MDHTWNTRPRLVLLTYFFLKSFSFLWKLYVQLRIHETVSPQSNLVYDNMEPEVYQ